MSDYGESEEGGEEEDRAVDPPAMVASIDVRLAWDLRQIALPQMEWWEGQSRWHISAAWKRTKGPSLGTVHKWTRYPCTEDRVKRKHQTVDPMPARAYALG